MILAPVLSAANPSIGPKAPKAKPTFPKAPAAKPKLSDTDRPVPVKSKVEIVKISK